MGAMFLLCFPFLFALLGLEPTLVIMCSFINNNGSNKFKTSFAFFFFLLFYVLIDTELVSTTVLIIVITELVSTTVLILINHLGFSRSKSKLGYNFDSRIISSIINHINGFKDNIWGSFSLFYDTLHQQSNTFTQLTQVLTWNAFLGNEKIQDVQGVPCIPIFIPCSIIKRVLDNVAPCRETRPLAWDRLSSRNFVELGVAELVLDFLPDILIKKMWLW